MKPSIVFVIASLMAFVYGCSDSELFEHPQKSISGEIQSDMRSLSLALEIADDWFEQMDSISQTRSNVDRRIAFVKNIAEYDTRSGNADTLLYLVNYENEMGFALLGASKSSEGIYAISERGHLDLNDTIFNI